jgi:hypothetical protein
MPETGRILILKPTPFDHGFWTGVRHWSFARRTSYRIGDRSVAVDTGSASVVIDAADITDVAWEGADVRISCGDTIHRLRFLRNAEAVADALRTLSSSLRTPPATGQAPVALGNDRLNDLVGLWQQGLISEAEYEAEKRHFS